MSLDETDKLLRKLSKIVVDYQLLKATVEVGYGSIFVTIGFNVNRLSTKDLKCLIEDLLLVNENFEVNEYNNGLEATLKIDT